jgi:hypothetical protein
MYKSETKYLKMFLLIIIFFCASSYPQSTFKFAVIGDYGDNDSQELDVANMVKSWNPDFIITTGDNSYDSTPIDDNIGQYYSDYIYPYVGSYSSSATFNMFWPSLGNHDYDDGGGINAYLDYFTLPNNERYYDQVIGNVHLFMVNSNSQEPDGRSGTSTQADWIRDKMLDCQANHSHWRVVAFHHAAYSSGDHGSSTFMRWSFKSWGAHIVLSGHDHTYERLDVNGLPYFVNGLGGKSLYPWGNILNESVVRYNSDFGAQLVEGNADSLNFKFVARTNEVMDSYTMYYNITSTETDLFKPINFDLEQNFPNPFNPTTTIRFSVPEWSMIKLSVYNAIGQEVAILVNEEKQTGLYTIEFDATELTSGIYFYKLQSGNYVETKKMVILR